MVALIPIMVYSTNNVHEDNTYDVFQSENQYYDSIVNPKLKPVLSSAISDASLPVRISFDNIGVSNYHIDTDGLIVTEVANGSMEYDIIATEEYGVLDVYATYADNTIVKSSIYTYCNGGILYLSEYSKKNALERYL